MGKQPFELLRRLHAKVEAFACDYGGAVTTLLVCCPRCRAYSITMRQACIEARRASRPSELVHHCAVCEVAREEAEAEAQEAEAEVCANGDELAPASMFSLQGILKYQLGKVDDAVSQSAALVEDLLGSLDSSEARAARKLQE